MHIDIDIHHRHSQMTLDGYSRGYGSHLSHHQNTRHQGLAKAARVRRLGMQLALFYKIQLISAICGSVLYSAAFEFACTICCTNDLQAAVAQW